MNTAFRDWEFARDDFLASRAWRKKSCPVCSQEYLTKGNQENCGSYDCVRGYAFLKVPSPKAFTELADCIAGLSSFFARHGFAVRAPIAVVRHKERTLFASTGGQIYDDFVYAQQKSNGRENCFIAQPVIRLQEKRSVGVIDGFSTSFLHTATECWNADSVIHFRVLDLWLSALSSLSLYAGTLCLKLNQEDNQWAGITVNAETISINYYGLEIGVANFFVVPLPDHSRAVLSDIGVGGERLAWAINKSPSYFDAIGPLMLNGKNVELDSIRTAVLMIGSGIRPEHRGHGSKLRSTLLNARGVESHCNLFELVRYYYSQWQRFISLSVEVDGVYTEILRETNRNTNMKLALNFHVDGSFDQSPDEFIRSAIRKRKLSIQQFCRATKA